MLARSARSSVGSFPSTLNWRLLSPANCLMSDRPCFHWSFPGAAGSPGALLGSAGRTHLASSVWVKGLRSDTRVQGSSLLAFWGFGRLATELLWGAAAAGGCHTDNLSLCGTSGGEPTCPPAWCALSPGSVVERHKQAWNCQSGSRSHQAGVSNLFKKAWPR